MPFLAFLPTALKFLRGNWHWLAIGGLGLALVFANMSARHWHKRYDSIVAKTKAATVKATADQVAANHAPAAKSQEIVRKSDENATGDYEAGRRAGAAYADAHRVRSNATCPSGSADLPGTNHVAEVNDRPGDAPDMVAVSRTDFDLLTSNSTRLAKVHNDAEALIANGVAIKSENDALQR